MTDREIVEKIAKEGCLGLSFRCKKCSIDPICRGGGTSKDTARQWLKDHPKEQDKAKLEQIQRDTNRCAICGWPLAASPDDGCMRGNCSMRPFPGRYYDAERARKEYAPHELPEEDPPTQEEQLAVALREAQAEVSRLRGIVEADTATLSNARKCISAGPTFYTSFERDVLAAIDMTLKLREGK